MHATQSRAAHDRLVMTTVKSLQGRPTGTRLEIPGERGHTFARVSQDGRVRTTWISYYGECGHDIEWDDDAIRFEELRS